MARNFLYQTLCILILSGCSDSGDGPTCGPGTWFDPEINQCTATAPSSDQLFVFAPQGLSGFGLTATVLPSSLTCLQAQILRADGQIDDVVWPATGTSISVENSAVAVPAEWTDCAEGERDGGPGIIGVGSGTARIEITLEQGGQALTASLSAETLAYSLVLEPNLSGDLPMGQQLSIDGVVKATNGGESFFLDQLRIAPRLLSVEVSETSVAKVVDEVASATSWGKALQGLAPGSSTVSIRYGLPQQQITLDPIVVNVTEAGQLDRLNHVEVALVDNPQSPTGSCYQATVHGTFVRSDQTAYQAAITEGVNWQSQSSELVLEDSAATATFCPNALGDSPIEVCVGALCLQSAIAHVRSTDIEALVAPASVSGVADNNNVVCLPLTASLQLHGGGNIDVTSSTNTSYADSGTGNVSLSAQRDAQGAFVKDGSGNLCFWVTPDSACPDPTASIEITVGYSAPGAGAWYPTAMVEVSGISGASQCF